MSYSGEWMFEQIKATAGLAMSTFKEKGDNISDDVDISDEEIEENVILSNWAPPPHLMKKWVDGSKVSDS